MPQPRAILFDAYGTLFDTRSVVSKLGVGPSVEALAARWRQKQLEYTWLRGLMGRYEDFRNVTEAALRWVAPATHPLSEDEIRTLMEAYMTPASFMDTRKALDAMPKIPLGVLSNGTVAMVETALAANGLTDFFAHILSADSVRTYKPSPLVYALGTQALGQPVEDILFVSANGFDIAGAKAFGYRVCHLNSSGLQPENLGLDPDLQVGRLSDLPQLL